MCISEHAWTAKQDYKNIEKSDKLGKDNKNIGYGILISTVLHLVV